MALMFLTALLLVGPVVYLQHLGKSTAQLEQDAALLAEEMSRPVAVVPKAGSSDGSDRLLRQINTPWTELLDGLEAATSGKIALLSLQPDARQGVATLGGEAARYADVLEYIERLKAQPGISQAFLTNHEIAEDVPGHPVRFTIYLKWGRAE